MLAVVRPAGLARALVVAMASLFAAGEAAASPEDIFGYGPRGPALGGTGVAHAEGFDAAYANPALLSRMRARKLTLGFQGARFRLIASGAGLPGRVSAPSAKGYVIGADLPIPLGGKLRDRIGVGLAFYTPSDVLVRGRILYPEKPQFPLLPDRTQSLMARLGVGVDVGHGVRMGAGFAALAEIAGDVVVATDATGRVGSRVEDQLVATYAPTFGMSYERRVFGGEGRVGIVYRGALSARFAVDIDGTKLSSLNIPILHIAGTAQYDPAQIGLEGAWSGDGWLFAAGVTYKKWSGYPGLIEPTIRCDDGGTDCGALIPTAPGFSDTLVPRVGVERTVPLTRKVSARLRAGYFLEPSPVPDRLEAQPFWDPTSRATSYVPNHFFDGTRHVLTLGYGVALADPLPITFDVYAQAHWLPPHHVDVAMGPGNQGVGAFGDARVAGSVLAAGFLAGVTF